MASTVLLIGVAGPAAAAGPPYRVTVGTNTAGTFGVSLARVSGTALIVKTGSFGTNCANLTAGGSTTAGAGRSDILSLTTLNFAGCSVSGTAVTIRALRTSTFVGTGSNATTGRETIAGSLRDVELAYSWGRGSLCDLKIAGSATASFDESAQRLRINEVPTSPTAGNLTVTVASGCGGAVRTGDKATLQAELSLTSAAGAVNAS